MTSRWLLARAGAALVLANVRYWTTVAPLVRTQLARWEHRARAIGDPQLRRLALGKLRDERFNAEVAATLATLAPRSSRARVVEAVVAMQVLYDYSDLVSEQYAADAPEIDDRELFTALSDAVALPIDGERGSGGDGRDTGTGADRGRDYYAEHAHSDDSGYLRALVETVQTTLAGLPSAATIAPVAQASAARCAEAQILNHQAPRSGIESLRDWAEVRATATGLGWQEFLAGATASVLGIHALIAAAADPGTTIEDAEEIDALYLSIGALSMLDSLVDLDEDIRAGSVGYVQYFGDPDVFAERLAVVARDGISRARGLANGPHHIVTLVGVVAYYGSDTSLRSASGRPVTAPVRRELRPLIGPTLALMHGWRLAKRVRDSGRHEVRHA
jgi:tetraprenyl-beta-curcumene synthase